MRILLIILFLMVTLAVNGQQRHWTSPDHLTLQYAGSIGLLSGGAGYDIFKNKARLSFHFGHVPKASGGPLNIIASKLMFVPRSYIVSDRVTVNPFDAGLMVSYHTGENFHSTWPDQQYPENYYWWKTAIRFHVNLESSVTLKIREHTTFKAVTGYIEFNSNELYLVSFFQNTRSLRPWDIIMIGAGARLHF